MEAQNYFNSLVEEAKTFMDKVESLRAEFPDFFNNTSQENLLDMTTEKLESIFKVSQLVTDAQTIFSKISSYLYFANKTGLEIDISSVVNVQGLSDFLSSFEPFSTDYVLTTENEFEIRNIKENNEKFKYFKRNIKTIIENNMLDES